MKKPTLLIVTFAVVLVGTVCFWWWILAARQRAIEKAAVLVPTPVAAATPARPAPVPARPVVAASAAPIDKAARIAQIKRDYDEIRTKAAADYRAAGAAFPGGLNGFLRQLALLEREKHKDLAAVLSPQELEDLEMRDTHAGQVVQQQLGDTVATDEQRRAVFRLQQSFDDRYALSFDLTPEPLLARERDRVGLQEQIRGVIGDALFASWLRGEGTDFAGFVDFSTQHGLAPTVPLELWRLRNSFALGRLELSADRSLSDDQQREAQDALITRTETAAKGLLGPGVTDASRANVLSWLPQH